MQRGDEPSERPEETKAPSDPARPQDEAALLERLVADLTRFVETSERRLFGGVDVAREAAALGIPRAALDQVRESLRKLHAIADRAAAAGADAE